MAVRSVDSRVRRSSTYALGDDAVGFEEVAAVEHDRIDLLVRHELDHLDLAAALRRHGDSRSSSLSTTVRSPSSYALSMCSYGIDLAADVAATFVVDAPAIRVVHLMQTTRRGLSVAL